MFYCVLPNHLTLMGKFICIVFLPAATTRKSNSAKCQLLYKISVLTIPVFKTTVYHPCEHRPSYMEVIQKQEKQSIQLQPSRQYKGAAPRQNKEEYAYSTCSTTSVTWAMALTSSPPPLLHSPGSFLLLLPGSQMPVNYWEFAIFLVKLGTNRQLCFICRLCESGTASCITGTLATTRR